MRPFYYSPVVHILTSNCSRRSKDGAASQDTLAPSLVASVLRQHSTYPSMCQLTNTKSLRSVWLLKDNVEDPEYQELLERFLSLPPTAETKVRYSCVEFKHGTLIGSLQAEENSLMGKLALIEVYTRFKADIFLSSMPESSEPRKISGPQLELIILHAAIAIPMGMTGGEGANPPASTRNVLNTLANAEKFFWSTLALGGARGEFSRVRDTAMSLVLVRAFQTSLGKNSKNGACVAASLLGKF